MADRSIPSSNGRRVKLREIFFVFGTPIHNHEDADMGKRRKGRAPRPSESDLGTGTAPQEKLQRSGDASGEFDGKTVDDVGIGDVFSKRPGGRWLEWEALDQETEQ